MHHKFDAHLAWSGGVESTAILAWAIDYGFKVKVFHAVPTWDDENMVGYINEKQTQYEACKKMEEIWLDPLGIPVHYCRSSVESKAYGHNPWATYEHSAMHNFFLWMYWGMIFTQVDSCKKIWYGDNYGLDSYGDGKGDEGWTPDQTDEMTSRSPTYQKMKEACHILADGFYGPGRLTMECPIPHRSKTEQWNMIPDKVKPYVYSSDTNWHRDSENYKLWRKENAREVQEER